MTLRSLIRTGEKHPKTKSIDNAYEMVNVNLLFYYIFFVKKILYSDVCYIHKTKIKCLSFYSINKRISILYIEEFGLIYFNWVKKELLGRSFLNPRHT